LSPEGTGVSGHAGFVAGSRVSRQKQTKLGPGNFNE
jgi:hypothetical protein